MPVDRAGLGDEADAPHMPDEPRLTARPAEGTLSDPADRVAVHRAYRELVDQANVDHRDNVSGDAPPDQGRGAWEAAVPSLRADWEEHKSQYPDQTRTAPRTHGDNSWSSGDAWKLNPGQNTEATRACTDIHREGEQVVFPAIRRIEAADPGRRLAGLEHMLKGADRMKEKIAERLRYHPESGSRQAAADVPDAVRFTFEYPSAQYTGKALADVEHLKEAGYELLKLKNLWSKDQYKGVNSQWRRPETGLRFEVQFHTPESREAKELTHEAYERIRDPVTSKAEEDALEGFQRRVNALVRIPPDVFTIEDYPPEKRDD
jgi:hypothetical protein